MAEAPPPLPVMFWLYGGGFIMGDASEENYLPGPLLDTQKVGWSPYRYSKGWLVPF